MMCIPSIVDQCGSLASACLLLACGTVNTAVEQESSSVRSTTSLEIEQTLNRIGTTTTTILDQCADSNLDKKYQSGVTKGAKLVSQAWKHFASCDKVERFTDSVLADVDAKLATNEANEDKPGKRCRQAGVAAGTYAGLDAVQQYCADKCFMHGDFVGAMAAIMYCNLAIDAAGAIDPEPWIRLPVSVCGFEFEVACDARFLGITASYANAFGACSLYTGPAYSETWNRSRLKSCDFDNHDGVIH